MNIKEEMETYSDFIDLLHYIENKGTSPIELILLDEVTELLPSYIENYGTTGCIQDFDKIHKIVRDYVDNKDNINNFIDVHDEITTLSHEIYGEIRDTYDLREKNLNIKRGDTNE